MRPASVSWPTFWASELSVSRSWWPGTGCFVGELAAERAGGVHLHAAGAVDAAQEAVVGRLDAGLADAVVQVHALVARAA